MHCKVSYCIRINMSNDFKSLMNKRNIIIDIVLKKKREHFCLQNLEEGGYEIKKPYEL